LKYSHARDEVINEEGEISIVKVWPQDNRYIFEFNSSPVNVRDNIENEVSNFNQHRLAVIRHKIETNLAIAISNYNSYSGATTNVFQMPKLKEDEWEHLTHNISLISFFQGLNIGGKIYNGYSLVTNSESREVVLEHNIYILGYDKSDSSQKMYNKIGDKGLEDDTIAISSGVYSGFNDVEGKVRSAGRLNLDFERSSLTDGNIQMYYYPLSEYNASYDSIIMQNNITTYDDIYEYVNSQSNDLKQAFFTALGRERYGTYKSNK